MTDIHKEPPTHKEEQKTVNEKKIYRRSLGLLSTRHPCESERESIPLLHKREGRRSLLLWYSLVVERVENVLVNIAIKKPVIFEKESNDDDAIRITKATVPLVQITYSIRCLVEG